ncbi:hypothetical protein [Corynebacterium anserum]|uniref:Uncharacterized protein n=1 Tax=Corynebacterium anserum TaxID=2684406 RepID=A0A7G7YMT1_9CORY|nr:hypothetical protein [Corynebacterium anserum]MBC2681178.1 hypothetical protein [Corynebacterium anserum]QNH95801.1 hypothetical protein GP473_03140 [Corynebacterium anserum]
MSAAENTVDHIDVASMVIATAHNVREMLQRSSVWGRMNDGTLPFAGRASYLEQHWEGLRVLLAALDKFDGVADVVELREQLRRTVEKMGDALDRSHSTARWRDHHVTMPSMLQFRRQVADMDERGDLVALVAHSVVRLAAVGACPVPSKAGEMSIPAVTIVRDEEQEEHFAEELSAALVLMMAHGSDVVRAYQGQKRASSCAVTAAMIRNALR